MENVTMNLGRPENDYGSQKTITQTSEEHLYSCIKKEIHRLNPGALALSNHAYEHHERRKAGTEDAGRMEPMYIDIVDLPGSVIKKKSSKKMKLVMVLLAIFALLAIASVAMTTVMFFKGYNNGMESNGDGSSVTKGGTSSRHGTENDELRLQIDILKKNMTSLMAKMENIGKVSGPKGAPGFNGSRGPEGARGQNGRPGYTGTTGSPGFNGTQGSAGARGPAGLPGPRGAGNFSSCTYGMNSSSETTKGKGADIDVFISDNVDKKTVSAYCDSNDAQESELSSHKISEGINKYRCRCTGTRNNTLVPKMVCHIHFWQCQP